MDRSRVEELHHITHYSNLPSIARRGLLSHSRMDQRSHRSIADQEVQDRRALIRVPQGRRLHQYVPLYFHARNSMMFVLNRKEELVVLRIDPRVLDLPGVVVTDRNAASGAAAFYAVEEGIAALDEDAVYATWWNETYEAKQRRSAEALVPDRLEASYIRGLYVMDERGEEFCRSVECNLAVARQGTLFFRASD